MSARIHSTVADKTHKPQHPGVGTPGATFMCNACGQPRSLFGRKLQHVMGMRQYVCKGCVR